MKDSIEGPGASSRATWAAEATIAAAVMLAYSGSFSGAWVLDDFGSIFDNPTIRRLNDLKTVLAPPITSGVTVAGRPILNLTLAVNYAISGTQPWSYHLTNLVIHIGAALTLFGIVRRLAERCRGKNAIKPGNPTFFAFSVAILWGVHPLTTAAVTYVVQRAESLMGFFYLQSIYWFVRWQDADPNAASTETPSGEAAQPRPWFSILSVLACAFGMATKEVMVSAPCVVLLLDRLCFAGSFRMAWRRRRRYYVALAATWVLLAALVWHTGSRGGTSGYGSGTSPPRYWATQPAVILRYLKLSVWPHPLVFDYGTQWIWIAGRTPVPRSLLWALIAPAAALGLLVTATFVGLARNRVYGLLGFFFFAILAPTSLIPGNRQTAAEHRMYLALVPSIVACVAIADRGSRALSRKSHVDLPLAAHRGRWELRIAILLVATIAAAVITMERNRDYRSALSLYGHDVAEMPENGYAQSNYGTALLLDRRYVEARQHLEAALRLQPGIQETEDNLGNLDFALGHYQQAEAHFLRALLINPDFAAAHDNLAQTYLKLDKVPDARRELEYAIRLSPHLSSAHNHIGLVLMTEGRQADALRELEMATSLDPGDPDGWINLGNALRIAGDPTKAASAYAEAIRADPASGLAYYDRAGMMLDLGRYAEAESDLRAAVRLEPDNPSAHQNLGNALLAEGRTEDALSEYEAAIRIAPEHAATHYNYGNALLRAGRRAEAVAQFQQALRLDSGFDYARQMLRKLGAPEP